MSLSFLDLPGEIRNQIYTLLLVIPSLSTPRTLGDPSIYPAILLTCRKIHLESAQILYGSNTFLAHPNLLSGLPRLRHYYSVISYPSMISLMRKFHIRIRIDCDPNFKAESATKAFTGMDELTIEVFQASFGSCDHESLKLFEGIRGVKKAKIYGSVIAFCAYAVWLQNSMMAGVGQAVEEFDEDRVEREMIEKEGRPYDL